MPENGTPRRTLVRVGVPACLVVFLWTLYWSTASVHWSGDGILYAGAVDAIRAGRLLPVNVGTFLHAHHVLYAPVGLLFHLAWSADTPAVLTLGLLDGILGAAGAGLVYFLALYWGLRPPAAALGAASLALSHGWWFYSVNIEVYVLAQVGVLAFFLALAAWDAPWRAGLGGPGARRSAALAAAWTLAVLGHIVNVLLVVPLVVVAARRRRLGPLAVVTMLAGTATLAIYAAASAWVLGSAGPSAIVEYARPRWAETWFDAHAASGLARTATATLSAIGPSIAGVTFPPGAAYAALAATALAFRRRSGGPTGWPTFGRGAVLAAWFAPFALWFAVWDAGNVEFTTWLLPPAFVALAVAVDGARSHRLRSILLTAWVIVLAGAAWDTWHGRIAPLRDPETNHLLSVTRWLGARLEPEDLLLVSEIGEASEYKFYLPYFADRRAYWVKTRARDLGPEHWQRELGALREDVAAGRRRAFAMDELFLETTLAALERTGADSGAALRALAPEFRERDRLHLADGGEVVLREWVPR